MLNKILGNDRIAELQAKQAREEEVINSSKSKGAGLLQKAKKTEKLIDEHFNYLLENNQVQTQTRLVKEPASSVASWDENSFKLCKPSGVNLSSEIRIGKKEEFRSDESHYEIPEFVPFIGEDKTIVIKSSDLSGIELLQSLVVRTVLLLPHQARFTLLDPAGNGTAFPMHRNLTSVRSTEEDLYRVLNEVISDIRRIIQTYLDAEVNSFEKLPEGVRSSESFEFIFAANFPDNYDRRTIEVLVNIARTGTKAGKYLFIHYNSQVEFPRGMGIEDFSNAYFIDLDNPAPPETACQLEFIPDSAPSQSLQNQLFETLKQGKPQENIIDWEKTVGIPESEWWQSSADKKIISPLGVTGINSPLNIYFGEDERGTICAHGVLAGTTGCGKSNSYHAFILGSVVRYSPQELEIWLVDGKDGVEFQPYKDLPHARVVSLQSPPELSRSILTELLAEKERRNSIFTQVGVPDLVVYRQQGQPLGNLPRIILIVDEYQELFINDQENTASEALFNLASQARSVGIHLLLGSQSFGVKGIQDKNKIFANFHLRMAMQMADDVRGNVTELGRQGKKLIANCDKRGKIVVNDRAGNDGEGANRLGNVAHVAPEVRSALIEKLNDKYRETNGESCPPAVVFDGQEQPNLSDNREFDLVLQQQQWQTHQQWQTFARQPITEGGLGVPHWLSAERPCLMWIGQELNVHGQAQVILRRSFGENLLFVGGKNTVRYGMFSAATASLAVNYSPEYLEFSIIDRSMLETDWCDALTVVKDRLLVPYNFSTNLVKDSNQVESTIENLLAELEKRSQLTDEQCLQQKTLVCLMTELERVDSLRRQDDGYGMVDSPLGEKLSRLCAEGARYGIHLILSFSSYRAMSRVINPRKTLTHFNHRVTLQMSEDDSFSLMASRDASRLQQDGERPVYGLYRNLESDRLVRFKPYSLESNVAWDEQLTQITTALSNRTVNQ